MLMYVQAQYKYTLLLLLLLLLLFFIFYFFLIIIIICCCCFLFCFVRTIETVKYPAFLPCKEVAP